jgi:tetratricopeptide (TPR) repeat protein
MKNFIILLLLIMSGVSAFSQIPLTVAPSGGNKKAVSGEQIGLTKVTINYDRPGVKGREGKVWGQLVHTGFTDQQFGSSKNAPWRAGANENTTMEFSTDVKINGQDLPAGKYGFFIAYDPNESILIFSKNSTSWGSYFYNEKEDALRIKAKPVAFDKSVEWLKYDFTNQTDNSASINLSWEKLMFSFKVEVDNIKNQIASFRNELRTERGFLWQSWDQAAQWCLQNNANLEEALLWADTASGGSFGGDRVFQTWSTKAQIQQKLGRNAEAAETMKKALPLGSMNEIHQYARQLLGLKFYKEAFSTFKLNYDKNPDTFTTLMGLTRGYSGLGDFKNALTYAQKALPLAPAQQKAGVETMIQKLKDGKDVN